MGLGSGAVEDLVGAMPFGDLFRGKQVFVTGHTGFKGSWLTEWLLALGAEVTGYSLPPPTQPALFDHLRLRSRIRHLEADVRDAGTLAQAVEDVRPDFIFHLAAQALVREAYRIPVGTYATNVLGTLHLLEAARRLTEPCVIICVTTDKCYENLERARAYREEDPLGGYDPYSSSKAAAEIAIASWRRSFFVDHPVKIASARAGNVIGGGDWAKDRIVPDCMRSLARRKAIPVRHPHAVRPWQHVLEPLSGYLSLAASIAAAARAGNAARLEALCSAFNFGPTSRGHRTVAELVTEVLKYWPGTWVDRSDPTAVHEASLLRLATDKAHSLLGWRPVWGFQAAVEHTVHGYRSMMPGSSDGHPVLAEQIHAYSRAGRLARLPWAVKT